MSAAGLAETPTAAPGGALRVVLLCAGATLIDGYDVQSLGLAIPLMARDFHVAPQAFAAAASGSLIGMALGAMGLSPLADRWGRRGLLAGMLLLFGAASFGAATAQGAVQVALWRFVAGLGLGATVPIAVAATAEHAPPARRGAWLTAMTSFAALGAFLGGILAPMLSAHWGWRGIFVSGAIAPVVIAALCLGLLPASARGTAQAAQPSPRRLAVSALFTSALRRQTLLLWALFAANQFVAYALISWLPTLLHLAGWTLPDASRASALMALGGVAGSLSIGYLADRGRSRVALLGGYALAAVALSLCGLRPEAHGLWIGLVIAIGLGAFGAQIAVGGLTATYYPAALRSTGVGWASGIGRVGSFIGPLVLAVLMSAALRPATMIGLLVIPMVICALCVLMLPAALHARARPEDAR